MREAWRFGAGFALLGLLAGCAVTDGPSSAPSAAADGESVRLTVIGTNDVHGELVGLTALSGYVEVLRETLGQESVVLLDAGDMWQGTLASNMVEGASVVAAYNALGYDAAAIGNHEFDFGPAGDAFIPESPSDDPRGALKTRAQEARFPLLAANLVDEATGQPVDWPNVTPSTLIYRRGIGIGVVGVTTTETLESTIRANTFGLNIAPLAASIEREARSLRAAGADLVLVVAHAGGNCTEFDDPSDLSTCETGDEIFEVA
ncbi:MAG: bifunctional metallophosphatase/5'-nucleotidase, partial [Pseudomonadota bacterium]